MIIHERGKTSDFLSQRKELRFLSQFCFICEGSGAWWHLAQIAVSPPTAQSNASELYKVRREKIDIKIARRVVKHKIKT